MPRKPSPIHRPIQTLFGAGSLGTLTDAQLLELFNRRTDGVAGDAFAALVQRHGPMVLGVCTRILRDPHDAADAFQATFLVLVRRANAVRVTDSLGRWLYGVSRRIALQARAAAARRPVVEVAGEESAAAPSPGHDPGTDRGELLAAIDEEIARLPEKYRAAVVLCDLGGMAHEAAARQLHCPVGTVESRLSRGRRLLRSRLIRRGLAPASSGLILSGRGARAALPSGLAEATVRSALRISASGVTSLGVVPATVAQLMKGALRSMLVLRLKAAALVLLSAGVLGVGAGVLVGQDRKDGQDPGSSAHVPAAEGEGKPKDGGETTSADRARIASLERRLHELERRIDEIQHSRPDGTVPAAPRPRIDPNAVRTIRPRFQALVEEICVGAGQKVPRGDPLAKLFSIELAAAKNDYLAKNVQWDHDKKLFDLRQKLVETGAISQQLWVDTQNDKEKSQLDATIARDRLRLLGLSEREIDAIKGEDGEQKARFTLRSPIDGTVIEMGDVAAGDLCDTKSKLMVIAPARP